MRRAGGGVQCKGGGMRGGNERREGGVQKVDVPSSSIPEKAS